jgi:hypothetical protein
MITFDLDSVSQWGPSLSNQLSSIVMADAASVIRNARRKYFEDAGGVLFSKVCAKGDFRHATREWFLKQNVAAYHGSRLDGEDITNIKQEGLRILSASDRKPNLLKKLRDHRESHARLDEVLVVLDEKRWSRAPRGTSTHNVFSLGLGQTF